jgi:LPS export ABC transporter protein LptC
MKPQEPGSITKKVWPGFGLLLFCTLLPGSIFIVSCQNDIESINMLSSELKLPVQTGKDFEVQYTDSGRLQVIFRAPLVERYKKSEEEGQYYEFREGIEIMFYNRSGIIESTINARYGKYWEEKSLGFVRDSVVGKNLIRGDQLNTEELYWDRQNQLIYSKVFTRITNDEGVYYGEEGFESDQDFENYRLIGSSGTVNVEENELSGPQ